MKFLLALLLFTTTPRWQTDFEKAKQLAAEKKSYILLNFSGSDWCGPCMRLRKEVFESKDFEQLADQSLVLLNADFPRNKKNQLSKELQKQNESLADKYNPGGKFPYTLLLTQEGKVIKSFDGYPKNNPSQFIEQLKAACHADSH